MLDPPESVRESVAAEHAAARTRAFSVSDVRALIAADVISPDERVELIDGTIFDMSPQHHPHAFIKGQLVEMLSRTRPAGTYVVTEASFYMGEKTFVNPDVMLLPSDVRTTDLQGPEILLLVEVASSTQRYDRDVKGPLYARHGVPLFWLIDTETRVTSIHAEPKDGQWGLVRRVTADETLTLDAVPGFAFRLADLPA